MENVLIYEDDKAFLSELGAIMQELGGMDLRVRCESDAARAAEYIRQYPEYILCLLDIVDEKGDNAGFHLAKAAKTQNEKNCIVFITGYLRRLLLAPEEKLLADAFISKSTNAGLRKEMGYVLKYARKKEGGVLQIAGLYGMEYSIAYDDIYCVEAVKRKKRAIIHYRNGTCLIPKYLGTIQKELGDRRFRLCSRGCLVNMDEIVEIDRRNQLLKLSNGMVCQMSRYRKGGIQIVDPII